MHAYVGAHWPSFLIDRDSTSQHPKLITQYPIVQKLFDYIQNNRQNGIIYKAKHLLTEAGQDLHLRGEAMDAICDLLALLPSDAIREDYIDRLVADKSLKIKASVLRKQITEATTKLEKKREEKAERESLLPSWIEKEKFYTIGFDWKIEGTDHTGFYFNTGDKGAKRMTNFVLQPLIHVYSKDSGENRRLTEINNGLKKTVMELPSKAFTSVDQLESILLDEGPFFMLDGFTKSHLNRLKAEFMPMYPKCFELKTLGWQPEGFFAFYNKIWHDNSLIDFNEYGFTEIDGTNYLSMGFSSLQDEVRGEDDLYKNDKFLAWDRSEINFAEWGDLMTKAYGRDGWIAVACSFVALFRDIVFDVGNYCFHLYAYGAIQSGKSKYAESLSNLFFDEMPAFNLNQGTDYAFWSRLGRFRNTPVVLNEFDEDEIREDWFRGIKSAADGEGREKGIYGSKRKTTSQAVEAFIVLIGQYLTTKDDASVLSRTVSRPFRPQDERPAEVVDAFNRLKDLEKKGLSGILPEMLVHRKHAEENYSATYYEVFKAMGESITKDGVFVKTRIQQNYCLMLAMVKLLNDRIKFPFTYEDFFQECRGEIIKLSNLIKESDSLASFWKMVEFLLDQGDVEDGFDFKIEMRDEVPIMISRTDVGSDGKNTKVLHFDEPKRLLFLRLNNVHSLYMSASRSQTGKPGLNQDTIAMRLKEQPYYLGTNKGISFRSEQTGKSTITSSYVFDYDAMAVNLIRSEEAPGEDKTIVGYVRYANAQVIDVVGVPKTTWKLAVDKSYEHDGKTVNKEEIITCYHRDLDMARSITMNAQLKVTGRYVEVGKSERIHRSMQVEKIEFVSPLAQLNEHADWLSE